MADGKSALMPLDATISMISSSMMPNQLQDLVDRGWRRSGTLFYMPDNRATCCPQYTIRLDADSFESRKEQRRALNRWNRFVLGPNYIDKVAQLCPQPRELKQSLRGTYDVQKAVRQSIHRFLQNPVDRKSKRPIEPAHRFEVDIEGDSFTDEKYALYQHYQQVVHGEQPSKISKDGFERFLCSGLTQSTSGDDEKKPEKRLGSYHQCYRLDGKLIALGVLDLLPHAVSSVYVMYHDDVSHWNFGKISAMMEIALAAEGNYRYYYMGYYIPTCTKMRYKGAYRPSYILDPLSHQWDLLNSDLLARLSSRRFVSMHIERQVAFPAEVVNIPNYKLQNASALAEPYKFGDFSYTTLLEYVDSDICMTDYRSIFEAGTPGTLSLSELEDAVNLGHWQIQLDGALVKLEETYGWENKDFSNINSLKGQAAELAASVGPNIVKTSYLTVLL